MGESLTKSRLLPPHQMLINPTYLCSEVGWIYLSNAERKGRGLEIFYNSAIMASYSIWIMSYPISESMYLCFLLVGLSGIVIEIAPISSNLSRYFRLFCLKETRSIPFSMSWAEISSWALSRQIANKPNSFMDISWTYLGHILDTLSLIRSISDSLILSASWTKSFLTKLRDHQTYPFRHIIWHVHRKINVKRSHFGSFFARLAKVKLTLLEISKYHLFLHRTVIQSFTNKKVISNQLIS